MYTLHIVNGVPVTWHAPMVTTWS